MTPDERFGELRSLLQQPPSSQVWDAMIALFGGWHHEALANLAIPYALEHLERWPDDITREAEPWQTGALLLISPDSYQHPQLRLINALTITHRGIGAPQLASLLAWPGLPQLRSLSLRANDLTDAEAAAIAACPHLSGLRALDLSNNQITDVGAAALASSPYLNESIRAQWMRR